ncbi:hypothetical protein C8N47_11181 [Mangrovibacterium marinum]|uniref:Uncharacterized protein n=1 Tax=Mangrovibacterium marinum TaxID=1639118 RepID=A0A2T5C0D1_9BACT|nr:hypothetical protein [Mangrovibacterium marinum]PTN08041.1 hypothetical protein C8N47_11181 [Mangrovibacterium marinum]
MATLKIGTREFPFEATDALRELVKKTDIKLEKIGKSKNETRRFAFLAAKAASEKAGVEFGYTFENFINMADPGFIGKAEKLAKTLKAPAAKKKAKPRKKAQATGGEADRNEEADNSGE